VHRLETLLEAAVDKTFDKFEIYTLRNILTVPGGLEKWMRLAHYENLDLPLPSSAPTPTSIHSLRRKLQEIQRLNLALEHEHASNEALLRSLQSLIAPPASQPSSTTKADESSAPFSFLSSSLDTASAHPNSTSAKFTASQLPALKEMVAELKPKIANIDSMVEKMDRDGKQQARRNYIDGTVRRVVKEQLGEIGDADEEMGLGRRAGADEVESLETTAGSLDKMEE
jgi:kinetochore protein Mis12/MTW1